MDADLLRDAATMPSEWDVQSTLLRRALQTGVKPLPLVDEREAAELGIVERRQDFAELQRRILTGAGTGPRNWLARAVLAPIERKATGWVMSTPVTPNMIGGAAAVLAALALLAFSFDWRWLGYIPLLLALPLEGIAVRLARLRLHRLSTTAWWRILPPALMAGALVALGGSLMPGHGWGMLLLAAMTVAFQVALHQELGGRRVSGDTFLADITSLTVLLLPFALVGWWAAGVAALFGYAAASFFWAQYQVHKKPGLAAG
jgi:MFS family permease